MLNNLYNTKCTRTHTKAAYTIRRANKSLRSRFASAFALRRQLRLSVCVCLSVSCVTDFAHTCANQLATTRIQKYRANIPTMEALYFECIMLYIFCSNNFVCIATRTEVRVSISTTRPTAVIHISHARRPASFTAAGPKHERRRTHTHFSSTTTSSSPHTCNGIVCGRIRLGARARGTCSVLRSIVVRSGTRERGAFMCDSQCTGCVHSCVGNLKIWMTLNIIFGSTVLMTD